MNETGIETKTRNNGSRQGSDRSAATRYAIFAVPDGTFGEAGAQWLGWDLHGGRKVDQPDPPGLPRPLSQVTQRPRRYGFHATIRPPMHLVAGATCAELLSALQALCTRAAPIELPPLTLSAAESFIAFRPTRQSAALNALAATVVKDLDRLRRPLSQREITRRNPGALSIPQQLMLARYGTPHVLDEFRFHLTLTDQLAPEEFPPVGMAAAEHFAGRLSSPWLIEELCLVEEDADGFFQVRGRCRLGQQH